MWRGISTLHLGSGIGDLIIKKTGSAESGCVAKTGVRGDTVVSLYH